MTRACFVSGRTPDCPLVYTLVFRRVCHAIPPLQAIGLFSLYSAVSSSFVYSKLRIYTAESLLLDCSRLAVNRTAYLHSMLLGICVIRLWPVSQGCILS